MYKSLFKIIFLYFFYEPKMPQVQAIKCLRRNEDAMKNPGWY